MADEGWRTGAATRFGDDVPLSSRAAYEATGGRATNPNADAYANAVAYADTHANTIADAGANSPAAARANAYTHAGARTAASTSAEAHSTTTADTNAEGPAEADADAKTGAQGHTDTGTHDPTEARTGTAGRTVVDVSRRGRQATRGSLSDMCARSLRRVAHSMTLAGDARVVLARVRDRGKRPGRSRLPAESREPKAES